MHDLIIILKPLLLFAMASQSSVLIVRLSPSLYTLVSSSAHKWPLWLPIRHTGDTRKVKLILRMRYGPGAWIKLQNWYRN